MKAGVHVEGTRDAVRLSFSLVSAKSSSCVPCRRTMILCREDELRSPVISFRKGFSLKVVLIALF